LAKQFQAWQRGRAATKTMIAREKVKQQALNVINEHLKGNNPALLSPANMAARRAVENAAEALATVEDITASTAPIP